MGLTDKTKDMSREEIIKELLSKATFSSKKPKEMGGQSCGMPNYPIVLTQEELLLEITVGYHRGSLMNKELAYTLMELAISDIVQHEVNRNAPKMFYNHKEA